MHVELAVYAIHPPRIKENQRDENIDRTLLREPETELEATDTDRVHLLDKQHTKAVRAYKPDDQTYADEAEIGPPICETIGSVHPYPFVLSGCGPPM